MNHYQFIEKLFREVLKHSTEIGGRCYLLPQSGIEFNTDNLGQLLSNDIKPKQYPIVGIAPPRSVADYSAKTNQWEDFRVTLFFLTTTFFDSRDVRSRNPKTNTSLEPVPAIWDRMKVAAADFVKVLRKVQSNTIGQQTIFRLGQRFPVTPITFSSADRLSGIRLDMELSLYVPCEVTDYPDDIEKSITIPQ